MVILLTIVAHHTLHTDSYYIFHLLRLSRDQRNFFNFWSRIDISFQRSQTYLYLSMVQISQLNYLLLM